MSPVNSLEGAKRVITAGADEIYCGVQIPDLEGFVLYRGASCNIGSYNEFEEIVNLTHKLGIRLALILNLPFMTDTLEKIFMKHAQQCLNKLTSNDAVIVGNLGIFKMLKKLAPDHPFYASTFFVSINTSSVEFLHKIGFSRVILERHLSIEEIAEIVQTSHLDIEVFVHGGGCSNLNGNCYFLHIPHPKLFRTLKQLEGFNSPCRLNYDIVNLVNGKKLGSHQVFDPYTFCSLCSLPQLVSSGVQSLKIVGRCLNADYHASVTKVYREFVDMIVEGELEKYKDKLRTLLATERPYYYEEEYGIIPLRLAPDLRRFSKLCCDQNRCYFSKSQNNLVKLGQV